MTAQATWRTVTERDAWHAALWRLPLPHILQTWDWGATKRQTGWTAHRWLLAEGDAPLAAASLLTRCLSRLPIAIAYVPKGPVLDYADAARVEQALAHLEAQARARRAIFVKIDPDVAADTATGQRLQAQLRARGWRPSAEQIQFRNTMTLDLRPDEDALLAAMKQKTRYNIRLAAKKGVTVRAGGETDLPAFYALYLHTGQRDGFLVRPYPYYQAVWSALLQAGMAWLLLAEVDGAAVAGVLLLHFGPTAWYFYGASSDAHREKMPNYLLQWEAIRQAKAQGCTRYDFWGAPDTPDEADPMWGVFRFKQGFGGELVHGIGAWDFPVSPRLYDAYTVAMPRLLARMRRRHRAAP